MHRQYHQHITMKIFCLRSYSTGYTGFVEDKDEYAYFQFRRTGVFRKTLTFPKNHFDGYTHFVGRISKFVPLLYFFSEPIPLESFTIQELDRIHRQETS